MTGDVVITIVTHCDAVVLHTPSVGLNWEGHGPSSVGESWAGSKIPGSWAIPNSIQRYGVRDRQRVDEFAPVRAFDPDRNLRTKIRMRDTELARAPHVPNETVWVKSVLQQPTIVGCDRGSSIG